MASSGMLGRVALCKNRRSISSQRASVASYGYVPSSPILVIPVMGVLSFSKRRFLQEPHGVTSQYTPFFLTSFSLETDIS
jgi:hypothetical protein